MLVYSIPDEDQGKCGSGPRHDLYVRARDSPCEPPQPRSEHWSPDGKAEETFLWGEATVGKTVLTNRLAVVEPSECAKEEAESNEQEDERSLLSVPRVWCVGERESDGEEIEESGIKGVGQG